MLCRERDVFAKQGHRKLSLSGEGSLHQSTMFAGCVTKLRSVRSLKTPVSLRHVKESGTGRKQARRRSGGYKHRMKILMALGPFRVKWHLAPCNALLNSFEAMERGNDVRFPFVSPVRDRLTKRGGFDDEAKPGDVIEVGRSHWSGTKAPMVVGNNQPFRDKAIERLTEWTTRKRMLPLQDLNSQLFPRRDFTVQNLLPKDAKSLLRKRR